MKMPLCNKLLFIILIATPIVRDAQCGKLVMVEEDLIYQGVDRNFTQAQEFCDQLGGHLMPYHQTEAQVKQVAAALRIYSASTWLGAQLIDHANIATVDHFKWLDGSPFNSSLAQDILIKGNNSGQCLRVFCGLTLLKDKVELESANQSAHTVCVLQRHPNTAVRSWVKVMETANLNDDEMMAHTTLLKEISRKSPSPQPPTHCGVTNYCVPVAITASILLLITLILISIFYLVPLARGYFSDNQDRAPDTTGVEFTRVRRHDRS